MTIARISLRVKIRRGDRGRRSLVFFFQPSLSEKRKNPAPAKDAPAGSRIFAHTGMIIFIVSL